MKIELDIPTEFTHQFAEDRFEEFFERVSHDLEHVLCGRYEEETLEMMKTAFMKAKPSLRSDDNQTVCNRTIVVNPSDPKSVTAAREYLQILTENL